jgi:hypothetical protein
VRVDERLMQRRSPRVLVLTLYSGEAEYDRCRASLAAQDYTAWEQRSLEHLPNREAHGTLYRTIMSEAESFDFFLKLDADMVLADAAVLGDLVRAFEDRPALDHLVVAVSDWMTDSRIIGAHMFSKRVRWQPLSDGLYVDPDPEFPGEKLVVPDPARDLVLHAIDPSLLQAFHFGAHRALQAAQPYRGIAEARPHNARLQWVCLVRVWKHFLRSKDRRLGLAMLAADMVFQRELPATANQYSDPSLRGAFETAAKLGTGDIHARLAPRWGTPTARLATWGRALGATKAALVVGRATRDTAASAVKKLIRPAPAGPAVGGVEL